MGEFLKILLSLSVSGTLTLLLILGLRKLLKNKFSKRWQYYILILAAMRFLIPFTPDTTAIVGLFKTPAVTEITNEDVDALVTIDLDSSESRPTVQNYNVPDLADQAPFDVYIFLIWVVPTAVFFVRKITVYQGFVRYIKMNNSEVSDIKILNLLSECEEKLNIRARSELYRNTEIISPMMAGFFRPSIVLPDKNLNNGELSLVFTHELLHYKRRDMFYKWLIQMIVCIHWFDPFVYLLEKEVNKACELSCDEAVISMLDKNSRRAYGDMLLSFVRPNGQYKGSLASFTLTKGTKQLKERLGAIMEFKRENKTTRIMTGVLTFCIIAGAVFIGGCPVAAAETGTSKFKEGGRKGTYVYDESMNSSWYLDDNFIEDCDKDDDFDWDWDENDDFDWDWDENDDFDWDWDEKELMQQYALVGIEKKGKSYYYNGKPVKVFLDQRSDSSFYNLEINDKGTINVKVIRNSDNKITGVSYMTWQQAAEFLFDADEISVVNIRKWNSAKLSSIEAYYETDNVYILPSSTSNIVLKEYLTEDKPEYRASTEIKNNVLTISNGGRPKVNYKSYIEIYVPNSIIADLKVKTVSGPIVVENYIGNISLSSTSGSIVIDGSTVSGNADTVSGTVSLSPSRLPGNLNVSSHSGIIAVDLPYSADCKLKAQTVTGKIIRDGPQNKKIFSQVFGSAPKFAITLNTFAGNIVIG